MDLMNHDEALAVTQEVVLRPTVLDFFEMFKLTDTTVQNAFVRAFIKLYNANQKDDENAGEKELTDIYHDYSWIKEATFMNKPALAFFSSIVSNVMRHRFAA